MARLDRYRIGIPRELSEIRTQPWLSEGSLTCGPHYGVHKTNIYLFFNQYISLFAHIEQVSIEQLNSYIHNIYNNK